MEFTKIPDLDVYDYVLIGFILTFLIILCIFIYTYYKQDVKFWLW